MYIDLNLYESKNEYTILSITHFAILSILKDLSKFQYEIIDNELYYIADAKFIADYDILKISAQKAKSCILDLSALGLINISDKKIIGKVLFNFGIKTKENIEKKKKDNSEIESQFDFVWNAYNKKGSKSLAIIEFAKVEIEERRNILKSIPFYFKERPEEQYRKDIQLYIKNKVYNDVLDRVKGRIERPQLTQHEAFIKEKYGKDIKGMVLGKDYTIYENGTFSYL